MTSVIVPYGVTSIKARTFENCTALGSVSIPDSVTSIKAGAFKNCSDLRNIDIPDSVFEIGEGAFDNTPLFGTSVNVYIGKVYYKYRGTMPENTKIQIKDGTVGIADYALCNSDYYLHGVKIPDSVKNIGGHAFENCTGLTSVTIPNGVTAIGDEAFYNCTCLESVTIPRSVTKIGEGAFDNCSDLTIYGYVGTAAESYANDNGINFVATCPHGEESYEFIPAVAATCTEDGYTEGVYCVECAVWISGHECIMAHHVDSNGNTKEVAGTKATCTEDGYTEGVYCSDCEEWISGHELIKAHHTDENNDGVCDVCGATELTISVGETVKIDVAEGEIVYLRFVPQEDGTYIFTSSSDEDTDTYGYLFDAEKNEITSDDDGAGDCDFKIEYELTAGTVYYWGARYCDSESSGSFEVSLSMHQTFTEGYYDYIVVNGEATITYCDLNISGDVEIPETLGGYPVTKIGSSAFMNCSYLTSVTIPDGVTYIGEDAFNGCTGLTKITISDSVESIDKRAFYNCDCLTSVTIPGSVRSIGYWAFGYYDNEDYEEPTGITDFTIYGYSYTGSDAEDYANEHGFNFVALDGKTTSTEGYYTYDIQYDEATIIDCDESISGDVVVTDTLGGYPVTKIGDSAFKGCTGLTSVTVPDSVTSIGGEVFYNCTGLTSIIIPDGVTYIADSAFRGCTGLTEITIPDSVETLGWTVFYGCSGLKKVIIGSGISSIPYGTFFDCSGLTDIIIPGNVSTVYDDAFNGCASLSSVTICDGVEYISNSAFYSCRNLKSVVIPYSVKYICNYAFGYYYNGDENPPKVSDFTIYGYTGSEAETYANNNEFKFVALDEEHTHTFSAWTVTTEATCTAEGVKTRKCSVCGAEETRKIAKKDHDISHVEEKSTCVVAGVSYDVCGECGETFNYTVLPLADHTFSAWTVTTEATCTAEGVETRKCSVCKAEETRRIAKKDHDISHVEEKSTCVVAGVSYDVCGECGETFNYTVLPLADHTFSAWMITKEPTVFEVGEKQRSCTVCGFTEKSEIEKLHAIEKKDDKTGVSVICSDKSYDGDVEISVTEIFDGTSYHILNTEKGNFQKQLFDIATMVDGKKVQPNGSVFVKIPLPAEYNAQKTVVYYITNDGQLEKIESKVEGGYIIFETTHFSFYAIVDEKTPDTKNCSCKCHKTGFLKFIFKIQLLFQKLFKLNKVCKCGIEHY